MRVASGRGSRVRTALWVAGVALAATGLRAVAASDAPAPDDAALRRAVETMKRSPRGPFEAVRWFCRDGAVLPPRAGACVPHGGGIQHGVLGPAARELRAQGFDVAQVLASLDPGRLVGPEADLGLIRQLVLERFLIRWDDGWIFRGARGYRGALQIEDEEAAAERILHALLADPAWLESSRFFLLRELARALPLPGRGDLSARVRVMASELAAADPDFEPLRARIHALPSAEDAQRVRDHARSHAEPAPYEALASAIDALFEDRAAASELEGLAPRVGGELGAALAAARSDLGSERPQVRLAAASRSLEAVRRGLAPLATPAARLAAVRASLALEREAFASAQRLVGVRESRRERLARVDQLTGALYGVGLIGDRHQRALRRVLAKLDAEDAVALEVWRRELAYLARAAEWSRRWIAFHFGPTMQAWSRIEPLAPLYEADRLRGSPLLAYGAVVDELLQDAQRLSGVAHRVFGEPVGVGLRGVNPGLGRGRLRVATTDEEIAGLPRDAVALLPETAAHLPPVAAILTLGEGSSVSHVQLLARNLGIPNAVVDDALARRLAAEAGRPVEVAVSPGGVVQIDAVSEASLAASDAPKEGGGPVIRIDEERLRLDRVGLVDLDSVEAEDSGRICGPKAANLGDLRRRFPDLVPDGFVIPFGVFRRLLDRPIDAGGEAAFDWLRAGYARVDRLPEDERAGATSALLARIRAWIADQALDASMRRDLAAHLDALEGGVFVRSDTNVEDLPGFTGAGLNLTVPNVVGSDRVAEAIVRVWSSPFTERAYAWRQASMDRPELVFPSVLVQQAFPAEKSGVMVTVDLDTGDPSRLSIAVSEGVGGAVDGQATESLLVDRETGRVRFLSQATAPTAAVLDPAGGILRRPASGAEALLAPAEIEALRRLADRVESHPALRHTGGERFPADVEFAFGGGRLALLQLRPFVDSPRARSSERLRALDAPLQATARARVSLDAMPGEPAS